MTKVSAILLVAGQSLRMGHPKQLLPLGDRPAIVHSIEGIMMAGIDDVVVVTGPEGDEVRRAIQSFPVNVAVNAAPGSDMAGSVRTGLARIDPGADGVFVFPGDYPLVAPATLRAMIRAMSGKPGTIIVPKFLGRNGHPALFPRAVLEEIRRVPTLRDIIWKRPDRVSRLDVDDEGVMLDMDNPDDYRIVLNRFYAGRKYREFLAGKEGSASSAVPL